MRVKCVWSSIVDRLGKFAYILCIITTGACFPDRPVIYITNYTYIIAIWGGWTWVCLSPSILKLTSPNCFMSIYILIVVSIHNRKIIWKKNKGASVPPVFSLKLRAWIHRLQTDSQRKISRLIVRLPTSNVPVRLQWSVYSVLGRWPMYPVNEYSMQRILTEGSR